MHYLAIEVLYVNSFVDSFNHNIAMAVWLDTDTFNWLSDTHSASDWHNSFDSLDNNRQKTLTHPLSATLLSLDCLSL
jgi:hypothetical protein